MQLCRILDEDERGYLYELTFGALHIFSRAYEDFQGEAATFLEGLGEVISIMKSVMHIPMRTFSTRGPLFGKPSLPHMQKCLNALLNELQILKSTHKGCSALAW